DSTYCSTLVSKSYYLLRLSRYDEAIAVADEGLALACHDIHNSFYINKVVALLRQERHKEGIQLCEAGLERFPQNKTLWYNMGVALESEGRIEEAVAAYQRTIRIDPLNRKVYLQLGNTCYRQDLFSQALLCFNMYLLLQPDAPDAFDSLKSLNNLVQNKNENSRDPEITISEDDTAFEEIDLILKNRIALNEKYDTGNEIDIALTRQNHALLQSLKDFSGKGGFWETRFVPFFQWINENGYFDVFTHTLCYAIENETYKKIIEKNEKEIGEFFDLSRSKWMEMVRPNWPSADNTAKNVAYYYEEGYLKGIGPMDGATVMGPWELFNANGRRILKGTFNTNAERQGVWTWYNSKGKVSETAMYVDGKLHGANVIYFDNGKVQIEANYTNDALDGEYR
ncbi:MAG: tetratricopeptide repeat protein, partial [Bacteroidota bacterium]